MLRFVAPLLIAFPVAAPLPARAVTATADAIFAQNGLSVWSGGTAFTLDPGRKFFGVDWNVGKSVGDITEVCVITCAKFGAKIGADTSGKIGVDLGLTATGGTFDLRYPVRTSFDLPTSVAPGPTIGPVTIRTGLSALPPGPLTGGSALQVQGPTVKGNLDLFGQLHAFAGAQVCVGGCIGPALGPFDVDVSRRLIEFNTNNDGKLVVLGNQVTGNAQATGLGGRVTASLNLPDLSSNSAALPNAGRSGNTLTSTRRDALASLNLDIAGLLGDALGVPLSGRAGPLGYTLAAANAGLDLSLEQTITFDPHATGQLRLSGFVTPEGGGLTNVINFKVGDDVTFTPGAASKISALPVLSYGGTVNSELDLVVAGGIDFKALGVDIAGKSLGPLVDAKAFDNGLLRLKLYGQSFDVNLGTVVAAPFSLDFACSERRFSGEFEQPRQICASTSFTLSDRQQLTSSVLGQPEYLGRVGLVGCEPYAANATPTCFTDPTYGTTTRYVIRNGQRVFINAPGNETLALLPLDTGFTDADAVRQLTALGYVPGAPSFTIPAGELFDSIPQDVPEPAALACLGMGLVALATLRRRPSQTRARQAALM